LEDSEERIYEFDPEDIQIVEPVFNGQKKLRFEYAVKDESGNRQILVACKKTSKNIYKFLMEGTTLLKIKRVGTGRHKLLCNQYIAPILEVNTDS
jgi:hypothetical protein